MLPLGHIVAAAPSGYDVVASGEQSVLSFETALFSPYLLASTEASQGGAADKGSAAKTGDAIPAGLIALLGFACLASAVTLVVSSRKRG